MFSGYEGIINKDAAELTTGQQKGAASRFASRGITGGSIIDDQMGGIASNINKSKSNALAKLGIGKAGMTSDIMDKFNKYKMATEKMGTATDQFNVNSQARKGRDLANYDVNWQEQDRANEMMPGFLEDFMSILSDVGQFIPGAGDIFSGIMDMFSGGPGGNQSSARKAGPK